MELIDGRELRRKNSILSRRRLKMDFPLYMMLLLPVVSILVYNYIPLFGVLIAFQKYLPAKGFLASKWIGFDNFRVLFTMPGFLNAVRNTVIISSYKIVLGIIVPVIFTILLNEIGRDRFKKCIQTLIYLPHFISWVMLAGIFIKLLGGTGIVNQALGLFGLGPIIFLGEPNWFRFTIIFTDVWKEFGYGTVVYLAAVSGVDPCLYEAATVDGAGHWKQMLHVTLPSLAPIVVLITVLSMGSILNAGFDQIFNMYNSTVYETGDIIDTIVYRIGFDSGEFGLSTAAGLFKSFIGAVLVIFSNRIACKISDYQIF